MAIAARRKRGASCLVASRPAATRGEAPLVLGSAECSFHEFYGTQLGRRRKQHSVLYVTEVAVSPSARRQGIGRNLLQAVDILAKKRSIETLYLHVDVANEGAIQLYKTAGYSRVANAAMFQEFTRSLNLHPGAIKGRDHFLYFKNLTPCPVWLDSVEMERQKRHRTDENKVLEVFGFEIPA
jgi:GNAT superfamily N-acetyltransferase